MGELTGERGDGERRGQERGGRGLSSDGSGGQPLNDLSLEEKDQ